MALKVKGQGHTLPKSKRLGGTMSHISTKLHQFLISSL